MMVIPNRGRAVAVISALALAGGLLTLALLAKPTHAQAQTEMVNEWFTESTAVAADCLSEEIAIEARAHLTGTITYDAAGGVHFHGLHNVVSEGVGLTSGAEYVVRELHSGGGNTLDFESDQAPATGKAVSAFRIIRKGSDTPEDDFVYYTVDVVTINANGELTVEHHGDRVECY